MLAILKLLATFNNDQKRFSRIQKKENSITKAESEKNVSTENIRNLRADTPHFKK